MFEDKNNNLDDLIGNKEQPIIVQSGDNDKKFLYTLLILLVVLFIIALGLIAFLGGKYFGGANTQTVAQKPVAVVQEPVKKVEEPVAKVEEPVAKVEPKVVTKPKPVEVEKSSDTSELEQLVQQEEKAAPKPKTAVENTIAKVASTTTKKGLSKEELATIAQLVAKELAKAKTAPKPANNSAKSAKTNKADQALVASLQEAEADTLKESSVDTTKAKQSSGVKASSNKKVDTFNKVIVEKKSGSGDELSKLSAEIDTILQSEDVQKEKKSLKYKKAFDKEASLRAKELRFIVVKRGDTLSSIANRAYGRASAYVKIYKANPDLVKNPNRIYVGMRLRVPVDEEYRGEGN